MYSKQGFTLVETLLVVSLIGLSLAVALPNMAAVVERSNFSTSARTVVHMFEKARIDAINSGNKHVIQCKLGEKTEFLHLCWKETRDNGGQIVRPVEFEKMELDKFVVSRKTLEVIIGSGSTATYCFTRNSSGEEYGPINVVLQKKGRFSNQRWILTRDCRGRIKVTR